MGRDIERGREPERVNWTANRCAAFNIIKVGVVLQGKKTTAGGLVTFPSRCFLFPPHGRGFN